MARGTGPGVVTAAAILLASWALTGGALAQQTVSSPDVEPSRFTILEENDSLFFNSDKHYTQGFRLSDLIAGSPTPGGCGMAGSIC
jgi:hypothetical protein